MYHPIGTSISYTIPNSELGYHVPSQGMYWYILSQNSGLCVHDYGPQATVASRQFSRAVIILTSVSLTISPVSQPKLWSTKLSFRMLPPEL
jgi:hypothetical protein